MQLSIVILNWKVRELLRKCLVSIYEHTAGVDFEVFVVDNDSRDGSVEMVLTEFPQVTLIANNVNGGFAKGNNQGLEQAQGDFVLLLNPDTELQDNALPEMINVLQEHPEAGICGPQLLNTDGSPQNSVRRFPDFCSQALVMLKLHNFLPQLSPVRRYFAADFDYSREQPVDQVMGAAFMIRRDVLEDIGKLDEDYFIWFEEVDYCRRAKDAGYEVLYTPRAQIIHHGGESFAQAFGPRKQGYLNDSLLKYFKKHHGFWSWLGLAALYPLSLGLAWLAEVAGLSGKGKR